MWTAIITAIVTFLLTGLIGGRLVQAWQHRNWLNQQRILDSEKEYRALQEIFDEVASLAGKRHYRMRRLLSALSRDNEVLQKRFDEYDQSIVAWNERLNVIFARLTILLNWNLTRRLEHEIQVRFVNIGNELERLTSAKIGGKQIDAANISRLSQSLDSLQGILFEFNRDTLNEISRRRKAVYRSESFSEYTLDRVPTWELFKTLFEPRVKRQDIS